MSRSAHIACRVLTRLPALIFAAGVPAALGHPAPWGAADRTEQIDRVARHFEATPGRDRADQVGRCITFSQFSVLFDRETTRDAVEDYLDALPDDDLGGMFEAFQAQGSIWSFTATNGVVTEGNALTLTYSFVPDGTLIAATGHGEPAAPSNLVAQTNANFPGGFAAFKSRMRTVFDRLEALTNITYVEVADDGAVFQATGVLGARGDIRIGMKPFDGVSNVLGVNFFPQFGGEMILDSDDIVSFANPDGDFIRLRNVLAHEHCHGLGLRHVIPENGTKLMEPTLTTAFDGPQEDDIRGLVSLYGDSHEPNDEFGLESFVGGPLQLVGTAGVQVLTIEGAALERSGSRDLYGFTLFAGVPIALRVEPLGTTYNQGPENGSAISGDARAARNLGLRLWRRVSAQTGEFALVAQIDFNSAGTGEYHPPIPYTLAGYMVAEVYSTDGIADCQRYMLRISNAAIEPLEEPASISVFDIVAGEEIEDSDTVLFPTTPVGEVSNKTLTILSGGPGDLEIGAISIQGPAVDDYDFSLVGSPIVPSGQSRSVAISFNPTAPGQRVVVMTIPSNDATQPELSFILSGGATASPVMVVRINNTPMASNGSFDFGEAAAGGLVTRPIEIQNTGNAALNVTAIAFSGVGAASFSTDLAPGTIAPGGVLSGVMSFSPSTAGAHAAVLQIANNAGAWSIDAQGTGLVDCNGNGVPDAQDIADGTSQDCDANAVPDECETDTDGDGAIDACDECPDDAGKQLAGNCGCGVPDLDSDDDGIADCEDDNVNDNENENGNENENANNNDNDNDNDNANNNMNDNDNENVNANGNDNGDGDIVPNPLDVPGCGNGACGMGAGMMMPLMLIGLGVMRPRRRRR